MRRKEKEIFETYNELIKVRKKSLMLVKNWQIIDSSDSIENTTSQITKTLDLLDSKI